MWKCFRWILLGIGIILIIGAVFLTQGMRMSLFPSFDPDNPPKFIQADFVELDKIYSISKFRSGVGHDYSANRGEDCRSMKHYFSSMNLNMPDYKMQKMDEKDYPAPVEGKDVTIFSPVDGKILGVSHNEKRGLMGDEIKIVPNAYPHVIIRLMHVTPISTDIKFGKKVAAGEKVGLVHANQSFDMAIDQNAIFGSSNISYFAAMPDSVFAKYQARGVKDRNQLIITKEYRDAHPLKCLNDDNGSFDYKENTPEIEAENNVRLSGFDTINTVYQQRWNAAEKERNE